MKVVKWGVHGTGTCIGPGILLAPNAKFMEESYSDFIRYVDDIE